VSKVTKLIAGITALLVAIGALVGTINMTIGKQNKPTGVTILLNSPDAYADFIANHPAG